MMLATLVASFVLAAPLALTPPSRTPTPRSPCDDESIGEALDAVSADEASEASDERATYTGTWDSNWGKLWLVQRGDLVCGRYEHDSGRLEGRIDDAAGVVLRYVWVQPTVRGLGTFTLTGDGQRMEGPWSYVQADGSERAGGIWTGWRIGR